MTSTNRLALSITLLVVVLGSVGLYRSIRHTVSESAGEPDAPSGESVAVEREPSDWPMFRGGPQLLGVAQSDLSEKLTRIWRFETGGPVRSSAAIQDGVAYIGSNDGHVYALDLTTGKKKWSYATEDSVESTPCIVNGGLYAGSEDGALYCLDPETGAFRWKFASEDKILGSPNWAYGPDGESVRIVFGSYDNRLYCVDARSGEAIWSYNTDNYINGTPAVNGDLTAFGGCDAFVHGVSISSGTQAFEVDAGAYIAASMALTDRFAYVGHYGNRFLCIDIEKREIAWSYRSRDFPYFSSPAIGETQVLFGGRDKRLHCVQRATGEKLWTFRTRGDVDSSPVICGDKVVVGSNDGRVYLIALADGRELWSYEIGESVVSSPAVSNGIVVIGSEDGSVYAFGTES